MTDASIPYDLSSAQLKSSPSHSFDINIAAKLGSVELAILIHHISYWVDYNKRLKRNFHEGKYWMYESIKEMANHFPYWSHKQVERFLCKLVSIGVLVKGNHNKLKFDRTVWYTFSDNWYSFSDDEKLQKEEIHFPKSGNEISRNREMRFPEIGTPIPDTKDNIRTDNKKNIAQTRPSVGREQVQDFYFSQDTGKFEGITTQDEKDWKTAYPNVDIRKEIAAAVQWVKSNPSKSRKKNWRKFLTGWFQRQNEKIENQRAYRSQGNQGIIDRRTKNIDGTPVDSPADGLF